MVLTLGADFDVDVDIYRGQIYGVVDESLRTEG
jgi:hypothetical protein